MDSLPEVGPLSEVGISEKHQALWSGLPSDEGYSSPVQRSTLEYADSSAESQEDEPQPRTKKVFSMEEESISPGSPNKQRQIYKVVLTGGPCGGKTTGQDRLFSFFDSLGWKVFTVPETATILLGGKVKFSELTADASYQFQMDLLRTMLQIEQTLFNQAEHVADRNVLIICDRGAMDPSAYMPRDDWLRMLSEIGVDEFDLVNNRYNQVIHMVTAADGAEQYYTQANNATRSEGMQAAKSQDEKTRKSPTNVRKLGMTATVSITTSDQIVVGLFDKSFVTIKWIPPYNQQGVTKTRVCVRYHSILGRKHVWLGHPYFDIVDNSDCTKFEDKVLKAIQTVSDRAGVHNVKDRLSKYSKKRKWLVRSFDESLFVKYEEYQMQHCYLLADTNKIQVRIRSRVQKGKGSSYSITTRAYHTDTKECVETRMPINQREYTRYMEMADRSRACLYKKRRTFMVGNQYFNLDIYCNPLPPAAGGERLMFLETYTTAPKGSAKPQLPDFLEVAKEVTGDSSYSMYTLSKLPGKKCEREEFLGAGEFKDD